MAIHKLSVLIADNQVLTREGIKALLHGHRDFEVAGEAADSKELFAALQHGLPDVIIMDYCLPGFFSLQDIDRIYSQYPGANILVVTTSQNKNDILKALDFGISNYILKLCDKEEFMSALYATVKKERFFCGRVIDAILDKRLDKTESCEGFNLSPREIEIVQHISKGYTNSAIADALFLSVHTVGTHRKNILKKLGLNKSSELIMFAVKNGLVSAAEV